MFTIIIDKYVASSKVYVSCYMAIRAWEMYAETKTLLHSGQCLYAVIVNLYGK